MNHQNGYRSIRIVTVASAIAAILAGCATSPPAPPGSAELRSKLTLLQSETTLATRIPVALEQAERAVVLAEKPQDDAELAAHRVFMADRMIDTARATAETRLAEAQRPALEQLADNARLTARTREADAANSAAATARADAATARDATEAARVDARSARAEADAARRATDAAAAAAMLSEEREEELARQISLLQATMTERGIVLTLGDVLFATGSDNLRAGAGGNLDRLVNFMDVYGDRTASIEGHTDSVGAEAYNQDLSLRRAAAVKAYLASRGVASSRLTSVGRGETDPVASNESAAGRQQNRRVEIVIQNDISQAAAAR